METVVSEPVTAADRARADEYDARFALARGRLLAICTGLVGADTAQDVVHDAYLRGRGRWHQLRDEDLFAAWLTRLAVNLCINRQRAGRRLRDRLPFLVPSSRTAETRDIGLRELIEALPPRERTLIVLYYGHGYRLEEIARITGLSSANVRSIVFRARNRLADQLREADR